MERLESLPTAKLWDIFQQLSKIPHASGNEGPIAKWILGFAQKNDIEAYCDTVGNVILTKKATEGMENKPVICMQGHLDMVAVKAEGSNHDFSKDPLSLHIKEINDIPYVMADNTTLGADNCIGVAAALAIMADQDIEHGPLEALFTVAEETSKVGMDAIKAGQLKCTYMLNLDSENDEEVTIGCAGGEDACFEIPLNETKYDNCCEITLSLSGLTGGHSGIEIHKHRANGIQTMAIILRELAKTCSFAIKSINGGLFRNAIPVECRAVLVCEQETAKKIANLCTEIETKVKEQYERTDPNLILITEIFENSAPLVAANAEATTKIINVLCAMPDGVLTMSEEIADKVENSCNIGLIRTENGMISTDSLLRSLKNTDPINSILQGVADKYGVTVKFTNKYHSWIPNKNSKLLKTFEQIYEDFNFKKPNVSVLHAAVECGIILDEYPNLDVISFGPTIIGAHTIEEKVSIYSVEKFYGLLVELIEEIE